MTSNALASRTRRAVLGGVSIAALVRHAMRPDPTFRMQLLAARCGSVARDATGTAPPAR